MNRILFVFIHIIITSHLPFMASAQINSNIETFAHEVIDKSDHTPILNPVESNTGFYIFVNSNEPKFFAGDVNQWQPEAFIKYNSWQWIFIDKARADLSGRKYKLFGNGNYFADPNSRFYYIDNYGEHSLLTPNTETPYIERIYSVPSNAQLKPRFLQVMVSDPRASHSPVMIMHDGQNLFSPNAPNGGWKIPEAITSLSGVEKPIIVGIDNTFERMQEYTHTPDWNQNHNLGDAYADYITNEVKPLIEVNYNTNGIWGIAGSSLGGLISLYINYKYPDAFHFVASLSGTLGWGNYGNKGANMRELYDETTKFTSLAVIYLDSGGFPGYDGVCRDRDGDGGFEDDGDDSDNYCVNLNFYNTHKSNYTIHYFWDPYAGHNEKAWAFRFANVIRLFLKSN